jgi:hypothetical protein
MRARGRSGSGCGPRWPTARALTSTPSRSECGGAATQSCSSAVEHDVQRHWVPCVCEGAFPGGFRFNDYYAPPPVRCSANCYCARERAYYCGKSNTLEFVLYYSRMSVRPVAAGPRARPRGRPGCGGGPVYSMSLAVRSAVMLMQHNHAYGSDHHTFFMRSVARIAGLGPTY